MTVVISGVTGFVGAALAEIFARECSVLGVSRQKIQSSTYKVLTCDIRRPIPEFDIDEGAVFIHCAAEIRSPDWFDHWSGNVEATKNFLDLAVRSKASRFIYLSSGAVYGPHLSGPAVESDLYKGVGHYAFSKYLAEELCRGYEANFALPVVVFRLYFPFAMGQSAGVFCFLSSAISSGRPIFLNLHGSPMMSVTAIADVVSAVVLSARSNFSPGFYNLCGDEQFTVADIVNRLEEVLRVKAVVNETGKWAGQFTADNSKLKACGWCPVHSFDDYLLQLGSVRN